MEKLKYCFNWKTCLNNENSTLLIINLINCLSSFFNRIFVQTSLLLWHDSPFQIYIRAACTSFQFTHSTQKGAQIQLYCLQRCFDLLKSSSLLKRVRFLSCFFSSKKMYFDIAWQKKTKRFKNFTILDASPDTLNGFIWRTPFFYIHAHILRPWQNYFMFSKYKQYHRCQVNLLIFRFLFFKKGNWLFVIIIILVCAMHSSSVFTCNVVKKTP